jgi:murein DD-endopeptidase MepM/ murein hydrolase activator NlpD
MRKILGTFILMLYLTGCGSIWGPPKTVTVSKGDTLYSISKRYAVSLRDLIDINNLKPPYTLKIGETLQIPANNYHIVAKGDTMYNISKRYNLTIQELAQANDIQPPYTLMIGQRIDLYGETKATLSERPAVAATYNKRSQQQIPGHSQKAQQAAARNKSSNTSGYISTSRKTKFAWPARGEIISKYGTIGKGRANDGINIKMPHGTDVNAADSGIIAYAGNELKGFGNLILIRHKDGWITAYAHNHRLLVRKGQEVKRGEKIASAGSTGGVNIPQLHFEIRTGKKAVNPLSYLP